MFLINSLNYLWDYAAPSDSPIPEKSSELADWLATQNSQTLQSHTAQLQSRIETLIQHPNEVVALTKIIHIAAQKELLPKSNLAYLRNTLLCQAIEQNQIELANVLLANGADPASCENEQKKHPIALAFKAKNAQMIALLIEKGENPFTTAFIHQLTFKENHTTFLKTLELLPNTQRTDEALETMIECLSDLYLKDLGILLVTCLPVLRKHHPTVLKTIFFKAVLRDDSDLIALLMKLGISANIRDHLDRSPAIFARLLKKTSCMTLLPLSDYDKFYIFAKEAAHWLILDTEIDYNYEIKLALHGGASNYFLGTIADALKNTKASQTLSSEMQTELIKAFEAASYDQTAADIAQSIRDNKLTIIPCGFNGHSIILVQYDDFLCVCNLARLDPTKRLVLHYIDKTKLTEQMIREIRSYKKLEPQVVIPYFDHELPKKLKSSFKEDSEENFVSAFNENLKMAEQKGRFCAKASPKAALRAAWALLARKNH